MKLLNIYLAGILLSLPAGFAPAPSRPGDTRQPAPADCSFLLRPILEQSVVPGMVGAVVQGTRLIESGAAGVRAKGSPEAVTVNDSFHLGSCTKAMTATMIAMLVEEGKLSWSTTIADVFPERAESMKAQWRTVTLEQLLTHRAGAPADLTKDGLWGRLWNFHGSGLDARLMLLDGVTRKEPAAKPGSKFIYSNAGFAIAGAMAERATGEPWERLMQERLFQPLGMGSAGFGAPGDAASVSQPRGHHPDGTPVPPGAGADNPIAIGPAGIVHCTVSDWAKFVSLHLEGDRAASRVLGADCRLLKPESFLKLHAPPVDRKDPNQYAMGWGIATRPWASGSSPQKPDAPGRVLTHDGSNTMWFCVVWIAPERDFAVMVASNQGGKAAETACDQAAWALIQHYLDRQKSAKPAPAPAK